jgi:hypothetical protein
MRHEALQAVEELNDLCSETGLDYYAPFQFRSVGWQGSWIEFMGEVLWTEENDERQYTEHNDTYEPLKTFLIREAKKITKDLKKKMKQL